MSTSVLIWIKGGEAGRKGITPELDNGLKKYSSEAVALLNLCSEKGEKNITSVHLHVCPPLYFSSIFN